MKTFLVSVLLASFAAVAFATEGITFCEGQTSSTWSNVNIIRENNEVCAESPCEVNRGETVSLEFDFTNDLSETVEGIHKQIVATVPGVGNVKYPVSGADQGCDDLQGSVCPLTPGDSAKLRMTVEIPGFTPHINGVVLAVSLHTLGSNPEQELTCLSFVVDVVPK